MLLAKTIIGKWKSVEINSDINILGSLPDWNLINVFLKESFGSINKRNEINKFTVIKTAKSVRRFEKAISTTLIKFKHAAIELLIREVIKAESISNDSLLILFWNASYNNQLLNYLNEKIYFVAFYSGRISIKKDEVVACLKDLRERDSELKKWSDSTLHKTASKYLTLLKKFNLMEGSLNKTIIHPYLNDKMFVLFVYWVKVIEPKSNLLESSWLKYSFCELHVFIERLMQKKLELIAKYVEENNIEKPNEFVMKSVVNKSGLKVYIIQQTDKRIPLETIAKNKELRLDTMLEEMETIAASGTKLNLDYAIDEMLDEYEQEEILEYFKGCETSSLQLAQEEMADSNFTWEQLKIMRIKFLSQYGM